MKRFNNLMAAMDVKEESRKRALLLHYSGEEVNDLFDTLPDTGEDNDYKEACEALTRYFTPKKNVSVEIVRNTSAKSTIQCFESIFSRHGIPRTIVSDTIVHRSRETKFATICLQMGSNTAKLRPYGHKQTAKPRRS